MAKLGAIVPICILAVSGCAPLDTAEVTNEPATVAAPQVIEELSMPVAPALVEHAAEPPVAAARVMTPDDVRRVQSRLRDVGLDPGPADGIVGAKTKSAFTRLQAGCARIEGTADRSLLIDRTGAAAGKPLTRDGVVQLQTALREAGFNPGPIDGIYGVKTKTLVSQLPSACLVAQEFAGAFDDVAEPMRSRTIPARASGTSGEANRTARSEHPPRDSAAEPAPKASEDIRILQLRLRDAGFDPGPFDGIMGAKTKSALAQYEASQRTKMKTSLTTTRISGQY